MTPLAIVKNLDIFQDCYTCIGTRFVAMVRRQFVLQATPEIFHRYIIIAFALAGHGGLHAELLKQLAVVMRAILATTVGMMDQSRLRTLVSHDTPQRLCHPRPHCIAHDLARKYVLDAGKIKRKRSCKDETLAPRYGVTLLCALPRRQGSKAS